MRPNSDSEWLKKRKNKRLSKQIKKKPAYVVSFSFLIAFLALYDNIRVTGHQLSCDAMDFVYKAPAWMNCSPVSWRSSLSKKIVYGKITEADAEIVAVIADKLGMSTLPGGNKKINSFPSLWPELSKFLESSNIQERSIAAALLDGKKDDAIKILESLIVAESHNKNSYLRFLSMLTKTSSPRDSMEFLEQIPIHHRNMADKLLLSSIYKMQLNNNSHEKSIALLSPIASTQTCTYHSVKANLNLAELLKRSDPEKSEIYSDVGLRLVMQSIDGSDCELTDADLSEIFNSFARLHIHTNPQLVARISKYIIPKLEAAKNKPEHYLKARRSLSHQYFMQAFLSARSGSKDSEGKIYASKSIDASKEALTSLEFADVKNQSELLIFNLMLKDGLEFLEDSVSLENQISTLKNLQFEYLEQNPKSILPCIGLHSNASLDTTKSYKSLGDPQALLEYHEHFEGLISRPDTELYCKLEFIKSGAGIAKRLAKYGEYEDAANIIIKGIELTNTDEYIVDYYQNYFDEISKRNILILLYEAHAENQKAAKNYKDYFYALEKIIDLRLLNRQDDKNSLSDNLIMVQSISAANAAMNSGLNIEAKRFLVLARQMANNLMKEKAEPGYYLFYYHAKMGVAIYLADKEHNTSPTLKRDELLDEIKDLMVSFPEKHVELDALKKIIY